MTRRREAKVVGMTYGTLPKRGAFVKRVAPKMRGGYPMELVGKDVQVATDAINQGIDAHLEAVKFRQFRGAHGKFGLEIEDAGSLHTFLRRLIEIDGRDDDYDRDRESPAGLLASSIMATLDYEWI